jgi:hypothetical protein
MAFDFSGICVLVEVNFSTFFGNFSGILVEVDCVF